MAQSISEAERQRRNRQMEMSKWENALQRAMRVPEFCERYGPGRTKAYQEIAEGRLRARKYGRSTIITVEDAEDWLRRLPAVETANRSGAA
jgi:hypothetical protein